MRSGIVHVVGAGLSGLAAAERLTQVGHLLSEASQQAGGRCRSYFDDTLDCRIDNGNHLLVSGNTAAMAYVSGDRRRGDSLGRTAVFPFP